MSHYTFVEQFRAVFERALANYADGQREAKTFFDREQTAFLSANGITAQHLYDYAEDFLGDGGEPGYERALAIELVRRDYFLNVQRGVASANVLDVSALPDKSSTLRGMEWLPRIIPKARAKLRGELPPSLMYCCGGDRKFLKQHDIFPSEFLTLIWRHENDETAIVDWVVRRSRSQGVTSAVLGGVPAMRNDE